MPYRLLLHANIIVPDIYGAKSLIEKLQFSKGVENLRVEMVFLEEEVSESPEEDQKVFSSITGLEVEEGE